MFVFCILHALAFGGLRDLEEPTSPKDNNNLSMNKSFIYRPFSPESIVPTISLSNSHTPSQYAPSLNHSRARCQATRKRASSLKPAGVVYTSQIQAMYPVRHIQAMYPVLLCISVNSLMKLWPGLCPSLLLLTPDRTQRLRMRPRMVQPAAFPQEM